MRLKWVIWACLLGCESGYNEWSGGGVDGGAGGGPGRDIGLGDAGARDAGVDGGRPVAGIPPNGPSPTQDPTLGLNVFFTYQDNVRVALHAEIARATRSLKIALYSLSDNPTIDALGAAVQRGVVVSVLLDAKQDGAQTAGDLLRTVQIEPTLIENRRSSAALQHNKFAVIDDRTVVTGSVNWTYSGLETNDENLIVISNAAIASLYTGAWNGIKSGSLTRATYDAGASVSALFSPVDGIAQRIIARIDAARRIVQIAVYHATHDGLRDALLRAMGRGVRVTLVTDVGQSANSTDDESIADAGAVVLRVRPTLGRHPVMHSKYVIIDSERVFTGSFNWTDTANSASYENIVETTSPPIVARYEGNFVTLLRRYDAAFSPQKYGLTPGSATITLNVDRSRAPAGTLIAPNQAALQFSADRGTTVTYRIGVRDAANVVAFDNGPMRYFIVPYSSPTVQLYDAWVP